MALTYYLICMDRNNNNNEVVIGICKTREHAQLLFKETLQTSPSDTKICRMIKTDAQGRVVDESVLDFGD